MPKTASVRLTIRAKNGADWAETAEIASDKGTHVTGVALGLTHLRQRVTVRRGSERGACGTFVKKNVVSYMLLFFPLAGRACRLRRAFSLVLLVAGLSFGARPALAQVRAKADTALTVPMFVIGGGYDLPGGDFAKRFGPGPAAQVGFWLKTKSGWLFGFDYGFRFTGKVREGVLDSIRVRDAPSSTQLIGADGLYSDVRITGRGYTLMLTGGRVWPMRLPGAGANAGLFTTLGAGFWQHKINFEDVGTSAVQLRGDYVKGYDRLTNGPAITERVGYLYLGAKRRINFFINLEATQGFTQSRRAWDFSTQRADTKRRFDMQFGVRAGWMFSVYKKLPNEFYYE